jgi:hypothetical protein
LRRHPRAGQTEVKMASHPVYKIIFHNQNQVFEIFARQIYQSDMWGFIEVEEFVFGERSQTIVDPSEERLKTEFAGVKRSYIPLQSVVRIDEVEKEGAARISEVTGTAKVTRLPLPGMQPNPQRGSED